MEPINPQNFQGYSKQELFALFREFLEEYYKQREKELHEISLIERIVRVEEELKSLRKEMSYRFEALLREMNARFEALLAEQRALREEMNSRFEAIIKEMNARFEAQKRESDARFEALEKRFNFLQWTMMLGFTILSILITVFNFLKG
jgi:hypothetical protein